MHPLAGPSPSTDTRLGVARALLVGSALSFAVLWAVLWLPVLLTGSQGSLFLYPVVLLLAVAPYAATWVALVLADRARRARADGRRSAVPALCAVLLVLAPLLLWFGPVAS
ncbi:hypothetical protein C1N91_07415 [Curtobacterium sp. SGAir0471]|uniref:hypothetical protein n=1 Tax=Curtobacterium sp. SGAir0471 TaxID=2070337 RepID=UPI0010CD0BD5|nr:hypothetical protein [Curtobacterium sp. SGAir0471]QCR43398.1 hypothetical protein C1N91_07415 [Curtobacterium sp. SGAir0471]